MRIVIYGAGAWGTALAIRWAPRHEVTLVPRRAEHALAMQRDRCNTQYLPSAPFPDALRITPQVSGSTRPALIILGTPSAGLVDALNVLQPMADTPLLALCKGFIGEQAELPAAQISRQWRAVHGILTGPSFAQEVARGLPTAVTLASSDAAFANEMAKALREDALRIYPTTDVIGAEIGGAVKNVLAIAAGLCDGLALGTNARAALITRGLAEIMRLTLALGGHTETIAGLAGLGDLVLTCTGDLSRNRSVGFGLAKGQSLPEIIAALSHVAEGIPAAQKTMHLARLHQVEMPICESVCKLLAGEITARQAVGDLMLREVRNIETSA